MAQLVQSGSVPTLTQYTGAAGQYGAGIVGMFPGVPTTPVLPAGTTLPTTPDGNVVAPPSVVPGAAPPVPVPVPAMPAPEPTFWEEHGATVTAGLAIVGVVALAAYALGKVRVSQ